jgi:glycosyltransferase involved in cell wall biosynthesis
MNIVFFYSEVMGYTLAVIKSLVNDHGAQVHLVYWDKNTRAAFELPAIAGVSYYKRSEMNVEKLVALLDRTAPPVLYISGRMDKDYLSASVKARAKGTIVVSGFDEQWKPSFKNYLISFASRWLYKTYFDYIWVPGPKQEEYARRLGYSKANIIHNLYTADTDLFSFSNEQDVLNKRFVFTGRLAEEKGIHLLLNAFKNTQKLHAHDWELLLIGNGPLLEAIGQREKVSVLSFLQPDQLLEKMKEGGVFVLPSTYEPWGVVLHEYASAGFPIICSDACGAAIAFVKDGYNGFVVPTGNVELLTQAMLKIITMPPAQLLQMKAHSRELGKCITPLRASTSLLSILKEKLQS